MTVAINGRAGGRYTDYKPSDVAWLGNVPSHWSLPRTKWLFSERVEKGFPDESPLAATQTMGVVRKDRYENRTVLALKDLHLRKRVREGDFVISLRSFQGGIEYAHDQGIISPAYTILRSDPRYVENGYFTYLFKSAPYIENLKLHVTGIRQGQNIDYAKLSRSKIPLPPLPEQDAIARYLDYVDSRIQRYIRAKERLIELLEEQKRAVINQAVTRGFNPDVPLKPSGVEWLRDVPAHWEVRRLKTVCRMKSGDFLATESIEPSGKYAVYGGNGLRGYTTDYNHDGEYVLIGRQGALCGNVHIASGRFWATEHAVVATLLPGYGISWFGAILDAMNLNQYSIAAAQPGLAVERIMNLQLPVPNGREQNRIAEALNATLAWIVSAVARSHRQIELVKEYRTRLIADVVTGKLDVRDAAANLPDGVDEDESSDRSCDPNRLELAEVR